MFFITMFAKLEPKDDPLGWENWNFGSLRTVGYYETLEDARVTVTENMCDICETCYHYAVIEEVEEGIYPIITYRELYRVKDISTIDENGKEYYNRDLTYERITIPEKFTDMHFCGIG